MLIYKKCAAIYDNKTKLTHYYKSFPRYNHKNKAD